MPVYTVQDPETGRTVRLEGDSPPTEQELNEIFARVGSAQQQDDYFSEIPQYPAGEGPPPPLMPQQEEPTLGERAIGVGETALSMGTGATTGAVGYLSGVLKGIEQMARGEASAEDVARMAAENASQFTYQPRTEEGQEYTEAVGEAASVIPPVMGPAPMTAARGGAQAATGARQTARAAAENVPSRPLLTRGGKAKAAIADKLSQGATADADTARYMLPEDQSAFSTLTDKIVKGRQTIQRDPLATESIKQGFDEGVIAAVKASSPEDQAKMLRMVNTMQRGKENKREAMLSRPTDVAGNTLMERVRAIQKENQRAAQRLDKVANNLKGERVDFSPAVSSFVDDLSDMGVYLDENRNPIFTGSDIEGLDAPQNIIKKTIGRMKGKDMPSAYDVHRMKKFIDENVSYGKKAEGLTGRTEAVMKRLRRNLDTVLDDNFPEYNDVNTRYAETRGAIDALQDVAGRKIDLTGQNADKAIGTLTRRIMGNAQSRTNLIDAINQIEGIAKKYAPERVKGDLLSQVLFADELDAVFKPAARTSFEGLIGRQVQRGAEAATGRRGAVDLAIEGGSAAAEKLRGINQENAFKSIRELLKREQSQRRSRPQAE